MPTTRKVTISLPDDVLDPIDRLAGEQGMPRSAVIAGILKKRLQEAMEQEMKEGYLAMAKENLAFAEEALNLTSEVMLRDG